MMSELLHEVRNQRERIEELAEMMKENPSPRRNPETVSVMTESDLELGDRATGVSSSEPPETASDESGPDHTDESTEDQVDGSRKGKLQCPKSYTVPHLRFQVWLESRFLEAHCG